MDRFSYVLFEQHDLGLQPFHTPLHRLLLESVQDAASADLFLSIELSSQISLKGIQPVQQAPEITDLLGFRLVGHQFSVQ